MEAGVVTSPREALLVLTARLNLVHPDTSQVSFSPVKIPSPFSQNSLPTHQYSSRPCHCCLATPWACTLPQGEAGVSRRATLTSGYWPRAAPHCLRAHAQYIPARPRQVSAIEQADSEKRSNLGESREIGTGMIRQPVSRWGRPGEREYLEFIYLKRSKEGKS